MAEPITLRVDGQIYEGWQKVRITRSLRERDFWRKGVRAVMLSQNQLYAGGEGYAWIVFSDDGDTRP